MHNLEPDDGVPPGSKFETFVYADRVLSLDLPQHGPCVRQVTLALTSRVAGPRTLAWRG